MSDPDPRDLDLARRLGAGEAPDGSDPLHTALDAAQPLATPVAPEASARLWDAIAGQTDLAPEARPSRAPDRAPVRAPGRDPRRARWAVALTALVACAALVGALWQMRSPQAILVAQASGEIEVWTAPDGSVATLRPNSRLMRTGDGRTYALAGEAFFDVASDPGRPFTVQTETGTVRVLGTRFDVSTWGGETRVYVAEGRVELSHERTAAVLGAGEGAAALSYGVERYRSPEAAEFLDWQRGEAAFTRESAENVVREIEHHFAVSVLLPKGLGRETVSGVIALESAPQALGELARILGVEVRREGEAYRFVPQ